MASTNRWEGTLTSTVSPFWARKRVGANQVTYSVLAISCSSRSRTCFQMFIEWGRSNLLKIHNFSTTVENLSLWKTGASLAQKENMQPLKNVIQSRVNRNRVRTAHVERLAPDAEV